MNIVLGITGSIAAYKSADLTRWLVKRGHKVRVILTAGALEFVKPELFRYLGAEAVHLPQDDFNSSTPGVPHVDFAKWADLLLVAPLSANTLAKFSQGQVNDFLTAIFLAWRQNRPALMFPAMNTSMWEHPFTREHVARINQLPFARVVDPSRGLLACGDEGSGKLMEIELIGELVECYNPLRLMEHTVLITTGATAAALDPVRYMTNPSSGLTGIEIAKAYLSLGAKVILLTGHSPPQSLEALKAHPRCEVHATPSTAQMLAVSLAHLSRANTVIAAAAVADFEFQTTTGKIKKEQLTNLPVVKATDVLAELLARKQQGQKFVSFAAETDTSEAVFREKIQRKPVDLMIGNRVHNGLVEGKSLQGFSVGQGQYWFINNHQMKGPENLSKVQLAQEIVRWDTQGSLS